MKFLDLKKFVKKTLKRLFYRAELKESQILLSEKNVFIDPSTVCNEVSFGNNIRLGRQSYFYNSLIQDYSYLAGFNTVMNARIGKFCSIAEGVKICLGKHPLEKFVSTSPVFYSNKKQCGVSFTDTTLFEEMGSVEIGNDVYIGAQAIILDNVKIGNGAIIAANSVVTKDVPPFAVVGGTPAKILRYRFSDKQIEFLQTFKWWDKDIEWYKANVYNMHDIELLINTHSKNSNT